ncbi:MAG TPA: acyltransferase [Rhizomicrobium sp.]
MNTSLPIPRTFYSVQYLRGAGAMAIALWHGLSQLERTQPHLHYPTWGAIAVDIFFVISGFVMWHMMMAQPVSFGEYWRKRFARAIPFYWLMTSVVVAAMLLTPSLLSSSRFDAAHVLASYAMIPWPHPVLHGIFAPVIIPGWTLTFEIAFYAVLGFGLFVPLRWRAAAVIGAIMAAALAPAFITRASPFFIFYTQPIIADFASGVLIGWMLWNGYRFPAPLGLAAIILGFIAVVLLPSPSHFIPMVGGYSFMLSHELNYFLPAFLIVAGAVFFDCERPTVKKWPLFILIGDAAYSIYIVHTLVLPVVTKAWNVTGLQGDWRWDAVYLGLCVVASTAAGIACYRWVEIPLFHFFDRATKRKRAVPAMAPAAA